jgi:chromosome segregation ATPase
VVAPASASQRSVQPGESGRTTILELYQNVLEERDALVQRVGALEADRAKLRQHLRDADQEIEVLAARVTELEAAREQLQLQNEDLAGRLLTAQIRRLESEKVLFETKLEVLRAQQSAAEAAEVAGPPAPAGAAPERAP